MQSAAAAVKIILNEYSFKHIDHLID